MATKEERLQVRIDADLKSEVSSILEAMGIDHSTAVTMFYKNIQMNRRLPFTPEIPTEETKEAIEASRNGDVESLDSLDEIIEDNDLTEEG